MKQLYLFIAMLLAPFSALSQQPVTVSSEAPMRAAEEGFIWWNYNY